MPASERRNRPHEEHLTDPELNELVDNNLTPSERERAQTHLANCAECTERYRTLQATISVLQSAPSLMPRRSFRLTPEQAKIAEKPPTRFDRVSNWLVPSFPVIRTATLVVALLLLSVTAIDVITHRGNGGENAGPVFMQQAPEDTETAFSTSEPAVMEMTGSGAAEPASGAPGSAEQSMQSTADESTAPGEISASRIEMTEPAGFAAAPPAPAAQSDLESLPEASPAIAASPAAEATPFAAQSGEHAKTSVSGWRIAEFGLLLLLIWLIGSLVGRMRMDERPHPDEPDSDE